MEKKTIKLQCEMKHDCPNPATMIEDKGFIYCADHGMLRRSNGHRCRKLRSAEIKRLERGETLGRY